MVMLLWKLVPVAAALAGGAKVLAPLVKTQVSRAGMRFFRDLGRVRSRRRRLTAGAHNSLTVLMGREAPIEPWQLEENGVVVDVEELRAADGGFYDEGNNDNDSDVPRVNEV